MIDELRDQINQRLEELAAEADRLRTALGALNGGAPSASPGRRASTSRRSRSAAPTRETRAATPARARRTASARSRRRTASGSTRAAVLAALASGEALTAGEVAEKAGLGRGTVSTTLSKLSRSGEVQKAARGYQLPQS